MEVSCVTENVLDLFFLFLYYNGVKLWEIYKQKTLESIQHIKYGSYQSRYIMAGEPDTIDKMTSRRNENNNSTRNRWLCI